MGDFNAYHEWWYGRQPPIHTHDDSSIIVDWLSENLFSLLSPAGITACFPRNINNTLSIIDLILSRGLISTYSSTCTVRSTSSTGRAMMEIRICERCN
jgi:hypothetical protein